MTVLLDFLESAMDLHVHSAPDVDVRRFHDIELAQEAARNDVRQMMQANPARLLTRENT